MRWIIINWLILMMAPPPAPEVKGNVDFHKQILPILQSKCQPCHFPGGTMYSKLPFDRPATVVSLGEKLFTRIRKEEQRAVIRAFLAQQRR